MSKKEMRHDSISTRKKLAPEYIGQYNYCGFIKNKTEMANHLVGLVKQLDDIVFIINLEKMESLKLVDNKRQKIAA